MNYDVIIVGAGIAGLWLLNVLKGKGFSVLLVEKDAIGGTQTLASQGMIHGGQKYLLQGAVTPQAAAIAKMPERWDACLTGTGELDLRTVVRLSEGQVMWPAGSVLSEVGLVAAAKLVHATTNKLLPEDYPQPLKNHGPVYALPEKVLDIKSLVLSLAEPYRDSIVQGTVTALDANGNITVSGNELNASAIIFTAGRGNEEALHMLGITEERTQERPLRQVMIRTMEHPLYGHGVVNNPKPRVTVTSHALPEGGYVWYLGGGIAEHAASLTDTEAIAYAKKEMADIFPDIDWTTKEWATWYGVRAEAKAKDGMLGDGPILETYGNVMTAWPTKLTFVPMLADKVLEAIASRALVPQQGGSAPDLPHPPLGTHPWETAVWSR